MSSDKYGLVVCRKEACRIQVCLKGKKNLTVVLAKLVNHCLDLFCFAILVIEKKMSKLFTKTE